MRPTQFCATGLTTHLHDKKIATMAELMTSLGTDARRTVFRKLNELSYCSSYSHRGRYYTLARVATFDALGLWSHGGVRFSIHGTLLSTAAALVEAADSGYYAEELDNMLSVGTKDALYKLVRDARLTRTRLGGRWLYCAADVEHGRQQLVSRRRQLAEPGATGAFPEASLMPDELRAAIILFFRYVYYLPLIGAPGIVILLAHWLRREGWIQEVQLRQFPRFFGLPSLGLVVALYVLCFAWQTGAIGESHASSWQTPATRYAGLCTPKLESLRFKPHSRIITPPLLGITMLGTEDVIVSAIPFHRAGQGMETVYRLFDGDDALKDLLTTADARLVASCAFDEKILARPQKWHPRGYDLLTGTPPAGLARCPLPADTGIFLYHDASVTENVVCPATRTM